MIAAEGYIKQLFARRPFSVRERADMVELYAHAEFLAQRIIKTVPQSVPLDLAVMKLKEVMALCETAVALHPQDEPQMEMRGISREQADMLLKENAELKAQAGFERR